MEAINQKELAKKYKHLNGKKLSCYFGRIGSPLKMIINDVSLTPVTNAYGAFIPVMATIQKTAFNGKALQLILMLTVVTSHTMVLKVPEAEIDNLKLDCNE